MGTASRMIFGSSTDGWEHGPENFLEWLDGEGNQGCVVGARTGVIVTLFGSKEVKLLVYIASQGSAGSPW